MENRRIGDSPRPQLPDAPSAPGQAAIKPPSLEGRPRIDVSPDSAPPHQPAPKPQSPNLAGETQGFWSRVKSFFGGGAQAPKPQLRETAAQAKPEPLDQGWVNVEPQRSYKLPDGIKMDDVDKELEALSDEMFTEEPSDEDKMFAELEALPSPPKTTPKAEDDLSARLNRLREGYSPPSAEAQLSARFRDLTNSNIPSLETGLASVSGRRVNPQTATVDQIKAQSSQFMKGISAMTTELATYLAPSVDPKKKLDASKYASRISERIGTESQVLGNSIIQIGQRKDLSGAQKQSLIADLRDQMASLKKTRTQVQQFRFDVTKQLSDATRQKR